MENPAPQTVLLCTQCGGELHPDEGQIFLTCPFCQSTVYLDKSRVVFHWYVAPTVNQNEALGAVKRWMSGNQTVKDLDKKSQITDVSFQYFPLWYFKLHSEAGDREEIELAPAAATSVSEVSHLKIPPGDLRSYSPEIDAQSIRPTVPLQAALSWLRDGGGRQIEPGGGLAAGLQMMAAMKQVAEARQSAMRSPALSRERILGPLASAPLVSTGHVEEQSLVHVPLYTVKYNYQGKSYTTMVEAAAGGVFANIYPAKAEAPYLAVGLITALVFLCLATIPIIYSANGGRNDAWIGLGICSGIGIIVAPLLFALAAWVAAKV